jgi:murein DD-endopeptidase MepM/ murein hydrolase activator NlpD
MIGDLPSYQVDPSLFLSLPSRKIENATSLSAQDPSKTKLKETVKELEALFIYELLKEMRHTVKGGFLGKGLGDDIYKGLFDMEVARLAAGRGLGLGEMILKQMNGREGKGIQNPPKPSGESNSIPKKTSISPQSLNSINTRSEVDSPDSSMRRPIDGKISSAYGWRPDPFSGEEKFHSGVDIAARSGQEIYPAKKGQVVFSGFLQGYGNTVVIDHGDGFISKYGHNMTNLVSVGDEVDCSQVIALVGSTGNSTGPHLHFEVQYQGKKINPLGLLHSEPVLKG